MRRKLVLAVHPRYRSLLNRPGGPPSSMLTGWLEQLQDAFPVFPPPTTIEATPAGTWVRRRRMDTPRWGLRTHTRSRILGYRLLHNIGIIALRPRLSFHYRGYLKHRIMSILRFLLRNTLGPRSSGTDCQRYQTYDGEIQAIHLLPPYYGLVEFHIHVVFLQLCHTRRQTGCQKSYFNLFIIITII